VKLCNPCICRTVTIEIIDSEGRLSPPVQITIIINDVCRQTQEGDTVTISSMAELRQISMCRGLELDLDIRFADAIDSLQPLRNLMVSWIKEIHTCIN